MLESHAPVVCAELDAYMVRLGQGWVAPQANPYEDDDLLTTEQVADFWHVKPRTVAEEWRRNGLLAINTPDGLRYRYRDVLDFQAERHERAG